MNTKLKLTLAIVAIIIGATAIFYQLTARPKTAQEAIYALPQAMVEGRYNSAIKLFSGREPVSDSDSERLFREFVGEKLKGYKVVSRVAQKKDEGAILDTMLQDTNGVKHMYRQGFLSTKGGGAMEVSSLIFDVYKIPLLDEAGLPPSPYDLDKARFDGLKADEEKLEQLGFTKLSIGGQLKSIEEWISIFGERIKDL